MIRALLDLVLPLECAACRRPGTPWCRRCAAALERLESAGGPGRVVPHPAPAGMPPTYAWGSYDEPLRSAISAWKDEGRRDLAAVLAPLLARSVDAALTATGWSTDPVVLVPAPSSARACRARGERPLHELVRLVLATAPDRRPATRVAPVLSAGRAIADQARLGQRDRARNLDRALLVEARWAAVVAGRRCLLVDDVVTTGATLAESARALHEAGASGVAAATVAATRRRHGGRRAGQRASGTPERPASAVRPRG